MGRRVWAGMVIGLALAPVSAQAQTPAEQMQSVLDGVMKSHVVIPGTAAAVDAPQHGIVWKGAAGRTALGGLEPLHPDHPFRIASVQKPFTAAAIVRLAEEGKLTLDDSIAKHLPASIVDRVNVIDGVNHGPQITIRQLLNHTSGINSHDEDELYTAQVAAMPGKRWTPEEQIEIAIRMGARFKPGEPGQWGYSDTGYTMAGMIIARTTGKDYAAALRELLGVDALGLSSTWHELLEPAPAGLRPRAHQYFSAYDLTNHDPSFDSWGGGGYVSTTTDLNRFMRALFSGKVFERPESLAAMLTTVPVQRDVPYAAGYGLGLGNWQIEGQQCWGHPGFWSSAMFYCPALDAAIAATTNQAFDEDGEHTQSEVTNPLVAILRDLPRSAPQQRMDLSVRPRRVRAGRTVQLSFQVTAGGRPVDSAVVSFAGRRVVSGEDGRATWRRGIARAGLRTARACAPARGCATSRVRVLRPRRG